MTISFDAVDRSARCDCATKCAEFPCPSCPVCAPTGVPNLPGRPEPVADEEQVIADFVKRFARVMAGELRECLHCGASVDRYHEVRPCVYAEPCGHRQYQGRAPQQHTPAGGAGQ